jgi:hypothetical protein
MELSLSLRGEVRRADLSRLESKQQLDLLTHMIA